LPGPASDSSLLVCLLHSCDYRHVTPQQPFTVVFYLGHPLLVLIYQRIIQFVCKINLLNEERKKGELKMTFVTGLEKPITKKSW
jgi:hypothetical protein